MRPLALLIVAAALVLPRAGEAQQLSLAAIDSLATAGDVGTARTALDDWWRAHAEQATRDELQHAIWLRGKLALDAQRAEREYQRLVLEFPGGRYTDAALLRLGMAAHGRGKGARAASYFEMLLRDYPSSPYRYEAARWLERVKAAGAAPAASGVRPAPSEEPAAQERAAADSARRAAAPAEPVPTHTVQLGAFSTVERARRLAEAVRAAGFEPRLVRVAGSPLVRVRVGRFATAEAAAAARGQIVARGFEATVLADGGSEQPVP